jgi:hypothetical protein
VFGSWAKALAGLSLNELALLGLKPRINLSICPVLKHRAMENAFAQFKKAQSLIQDQLILIFDFANQFIFSYPYSLPMLQHRAMEKCFRTI